MVLQTLSIALLTKGLKEACSPRERHRDTHQIYTMFFFFVSFVAGTATISRQDAFATKRHRAAEGLAKLVHTDASDQPWVPYTALCGEAIHFQKTLVTGLSEL